MSRVQSLCSTLPKLSIPESRTQLKTFHRFIELPAEIRIQIWALASNVPRRIKLRSLYISYPQGRLPNSECHNQIPPLLHVSPESQTEALNHYVLAFEYRIVCGIRYKRAVFLNFSVDVFIYQEVGHVRLDRYIDFNPLNFRPQTLDQIQHLEYRSHFTRISGSFPPLLVLCSGHLADLIALAKDPFCRQEQSITFSNSLRLHLTFESIYRHWCNLVRMATGRVGIPVQFIWLFPEELGLGACKPRPPSGG